MVKYTIPHGFRQRILEKKRREEEKKRLELIRQQPTPTPQYYPSSVDDRIPRRSALKTLLAGGAVAALAGGSLISYLSSLPRTTQPIVQPITQPPTQSTVQQQGPVAETATYFKSADEWPVRKSLQELKDAIREPESVSQYPVQEYDSLPGDTLYSSQRDFANITQDEFIAINPDALESDIKMVMGGNPRLTLFSVGDHPFSYIFFDMTYSNSPKETLGYGNYYVPYGRIVNAFAHGNNNFKVLFRNNSGLYLLLP